MAIPGMDLQSQYEQTLQNTIGKSQRERLQATRQQSLSNTDWDKRGVGQDAKRFAGFQEVNPSSMPVMSEDTRSFINPLLGTYQEGGKSVEGYYGKDNPYTQSGLESIISKQGFERAPTQLSDQFKSAGLKLPNAYGQDYYNAAYEQLGNALNAKSLPAQYKQQVDDLYSKVTASTADWQNRYGPAKESIEKYTKLGFTPGKDNGSWRWTSRNPIQFGEPARDENGTLYDPNWEANLYKDHPYEKDSGYWLNDNGSIRGVNYSPSIGFGESDFDHKATGMGRIMPMVTMATLGAITGGAGYAAAGGSGALAGAAGGAAGALPSSLATGLNTGNWGKALTSLGMGAIGGGLGSYITPKLNSIFTPGLESMGFSPDLAGTLSNAGSKALVSAGSTGLANLLSNNKLGNNVGMSALSGALSGLGNLFAPEGSTPKQQADYGQLASTGVKTLASLYKQNKRK